MTTIATAFRDEIRRIFVLRPAFSVLVLGVLIYAAFYPQPYLHEVLRDVPIAIVDQDNTVSSRELARRIDATPEAAIVQSLPNLPTAQQEVYARRISGILVIPRDFERELLHGRSSPIALYADASYFLIYQRLSGAISGVARGFGAEVEATRLIGSGVDPAIAIAASDPLPVTIVSLFNPQGGYATYLLPAALVLIVQQTLLIGVGLLGTLPGGAFHPSAPQDGFAAALLGRLLAYLTLEAAIIPFYLIVLPYLYGLPRLGSVLCLLAFSVPFVLAVSALGMVLAAIFRKPLAVQLATAALGLPFFFLAGFAWPVTAIPKAVQYIAVFVPSSLAIDGFVRISQLGASLSDVRSQFLGLWALAALYIGMVLLLRARHTRANAMAANLKLDDFGLS